MIAKSLDPLRNFAVEIVEDVHDEVPDYSFVGEHVGLTSPSDAVLLRVVPHDGEGWTGKFSTA